MDCGCGPNQFCQECDPALWDRLEAAGKIQTEYAQTNCPICGRFTDRHGACKNVFQVEPGLWEHA